MSGSTAPPGAGKTSLVSSFLTHARLPHIWYRIDPRDSDPGTFFYYLELAAKHVAARRRKPLPKLTGEYFANLRGFTHRFFEDFYERLPHPFVLVLDDYQEVTEISRLHEIIHDSLATLPSGSCLIVISRRYPPPLFTRLHAYSSMEIIG